MGFAVKLIKAPFQIVSAMIEGFVLYLPGKWGNILRRWYYRPKLRHMGRNVVIDAGVQLIGVKYMSIGDNSWIDKYAVLIAGEAWNGERMMHYKENASFRHRRGELHIGKNCHIAPHVVISALGGVSIGDNITVASGSRVYSLSHHYRNLNDPSDKFDYRFSSQAPPGEQALISGPIVMEDHAALGLNSVVLPAVTVGACSWVAAGSVVTTDIESGVIAGGNPARTIKKKFE